MSKHRDLGFLPVNYVGTTAASLTPILTTLEDKSKSVTLSN